MKYNDMSHLYVLYKSLATIFKADCTNNVILQSIVVRYHLRFLNCDLSANIYGIITRCNRYFENLTEALLVVLA